MDKLTILAPSQNGDIQACVDAKPFRPFEPLILAFIQALSERLLTSPQTKAHPELVALGFWLRNSHIKQLQGAQSHGISKALGLVVHFTPANVDSMFVYSWVCALLMGNNNIIRVASAASTAKDVLLTQIDQLMQHADYHDIARSNVFVSYPKESAVSAQLSLLADARVMWGGDESVKAIRALPTTARCRDISFADRYSAALINGDALSTIADVQKLATLLWRDTQPHAQQACSSPRVVFWLGDKQNQRVLFEQLNSLAMENGIEANQLTNHLVVSQLLQSSGQAHHTLVQQAICAINMDKITPHFLDWHLGHGLFLLHQIDSLDSLMAINDSKLQTLSYWQVDKQALLKLVQHPSIQGIDRVVPVGQALDFSPLWDGYELFSQLSRRIAVE